MELICPFSLNVGCLMYSHINWSDIRAMVTYPVAEHHCCLTSPKAVNNLLCSGGMDESWTLITMTGAVFLICQSWFDELSLWPFTAWWAWAGVTSACAQTAGFPSCRKLLPHQHFGDRCGWTGSALSHVAQRLSRPKQRVSIVRLFISRLLID